MSNPFGVPDKNFGTPRKRIAFGEVRRDQNRLPRLEVRYQDMKRIEASQIKKAVPPRPRPIPGPPEEPPITASFERYYWTKDSAKGPVVLDRTGVISGQEGLVFQRFVVETNQFGNPESRVILRSHTGDTLEDSAPLPSSLYFYDYTFETNVPVIMTGTRNSNPSFYEYVNGAWVAKPSPEGTYTTLQGANNIGTASLFVGSSFLYTPRFTPNPGNPNVAEPGGFLIRAKNATGWVVLEHDPVMLGESITEFVGFSGGHAYVIALHPNPLGGAPVHRLLRAPEGSGNWQFMHEFDSQINCAVILSDGRILYKNPSAFGLMTVSPGGSPQPVAEPFDGVALAFPNVTLSNGRALLLATNSSEVYVFEGGSVRSLLPVHGALPTEQGIYVRPYDDNSFLLFSQDLTYIAKVPLS